VTLVRGNDLIIASITGEGPDEDRDAARGRSPAGEDAR